MAGAAKWLRRLETALAIGGISLLGGALAATVHRLDYQARQERALLRSAGAGVASTLLEAAPLPSPLAAVPPPRRSAAIHPPSQFHAVPAATGIDRDIDPPAIGRIEIPRVGIRAMVGEGDDDATLAVAVGHVQGTARPGEGGNTVLAGHRDTFFRGLRNIRIGDRIRLVVPRHSYEYRVISIDVVPPEETSVLDPTQDEELTLVTCYPFAYIGRAPDRFVVRASRVE